MEHGAHMAVCVKLVPNLTLLLLLLSVRPPLPLHVRQTGRLPLTSRLVSPSGAKMPDLVNAPGVYKRTAATSTEPRENRQRVSEPEFQVLAGEYHQYGQHQHRTLGIPRMSRRTAERHMNVFLDFLAVCPYFAQVN